MIRSFSGVLLAELSAEFALTMFVDSPDVTIWFAKQSVMVISFAWESINIILSVDTLNVIAVVKIKT